MKYLICLLCLFFSGCSHWASARTNHLTGVKTGTIIVRHGPWHFISAASAERHMRKFCAPSVAAVFETERQGDYSYITFHCAVME